MNKIAMAGLALVVLAPAPVFAESVFDGSWKVDISSAKVSKKPSVQILKGGMYSCPTCTPPVKIKADGKDQAIKGNPYYDTMAITVVGDKIVKEIDKKDGKVVAESTTTLSNDGKTATTDYTDSSATNSAPVTGKGVATRVAAGPKGSLPLSGSWIMSTTSTASDNGLISTYKVEGKTFSFSTQTGQSYTAKLGGPEASFKGDPGVTSVKVKMMGKSTIVETDKRKGKIISVLTMTVAKDGKSMKVVADNKLSGHKSTFTANKI